MDSNEFTVNHLAVSSQVLIVSVQLENGKRVSEKIIFQN
ncbi:hypothetical protein [Flavobacterium marginilacus]